MKRFLFNVFWCLPTVMMIWSFFYFLVGAEIGWLMGVFSFIVLLRFEDFQDKINDLSKRIKELEDEK